MIIMFIDLNTSNVTVNLYIKCGMNLNRNNLNTSNVTVNRTLASKPSLLCLI